MLDHLDVEYAYDLVCKVPENYYEKTIWSKWLQDKIYEIILTSVKLAATLRKALKMTFLLFFVLPFWFLVFCLMLMLPELKAVIVSEDFQETVFGTGTAHQQISPGKFPFL